MITKQLWGKSNDGKDVYLYTLTNKNGVTAQVTTFGARIVSVHTPDRDGNTANIILGPDTLEGFLTRGGFFGATIGRYCNRIGGASFEIDGVTYEITKNERGLNTLHGGSGVHNSAWESAEDGDQVIMTLLLPDGTDGFPGNLTAVSRFRLTDDNELVLTLEATCDKATVCSMTNHAYWNLGSPTAQCELQIEADHYLTVDEGLIPTGLGEVEGTKFDFRTRRPIGPTLYDNHFVFSGAHPRAKVWDPNTGRTMTVDSDLPGTQFFTNPSFGTTPPAANALCLEPQFNPDSPHHPEWPTTVLRPGEIWSHEIRLTFGVE